MNEKRRVNVYSLSIIFAYLEFLLDLLNEMPVGLLLPALPLCFLLDVQLAERRPALVSTASLPWVLVERHHPGQVVIERVGHLLSPDVLPRE